MFTIKYRSYQPCAKQPEAGDGANKFYDEIDLIDGPFNIVSKEMDDGYTVVHAHRGPEMLGMTFGPVKADEAGKPRPKLWVMNEQGATVATYDL